MARILPILLQNSIHDRIPQTLAMPCVRLGLCTPIHGEMNKWTLLNLGKPNTNTACAIHLIQAHTEPEALPWLSLAPLFVGIQSCRKMGLE